MLSQVARDLLERRYRLLLSWRDKAAALYRIISGAESSAAAHARLKAEGFRVDYVEDHWDRRLAAVFLDGIRLIDNVPLKV